MGQASGRVGDLVSGVMALAPGPCAVNFYLDSSDAYGDFHTTASQRRENLRRHLFAIRDGGLVFVGEAAGWMGARQSGVAFTSARMVGLDGNSEGSATIVHRLLSRVGLMDRALLWNAFPLHPHKPGDPRSNRTPTSTELSSGLGVLRLAISGRRVICVGASAAKSVALVLGHAVPSVADATATSSAIRVRHPAHGGATHFDTQAVEALETWSLI